ncbi:Mor transcription activator family protein [Intestinibacter bartlettii]|uniref:Mor transcription activator family protein n=1 Tax=Intestinibacter bartlettii TaxID=261299 RepID=UPI003520B89C
MKDNNLERRIPEDLVPLYNIVGEEKYKFIIKEMGGGLYYIPTKDELDIAERDRGIFEDYIIKGMKINSVAKKWGLSASMISKIAGKERDKSKKK